MKKPLRWSLVSALSVTALVALLVRHTAPKGSPVASPTSTPLVVSGSAQRAPPASFAVVAPAGPVPDVAPQPGFTPASQIRLPPLGLEAIPIPAPVEPPNPATYRPPLISPNGVRGDRAPRSVDGF
jgi:hypothetical protein